MPQSIQVEACRTDGYRHITAEEKSNAQIIRSMNKAFESAVVREQPSDGKVEFSYSVFNLQRDIRNLKQDTPERRFGTNLLDKTENLPLSIGGNNSETIELEF